MFELGVFLEEYFLNTMDKAEIKSLSYFLESGPFKGIGKNRGFLILQVYAGQCHQHLALLLFCLLLSSQAKQLPSSVKLLLVTGMSLLSNSSFGFNQTCVPFV